VITSSRNNYIHNLKNLEGTIFKLEQRKEKVKEVRRHEQKLLELNTQMQQLGEFQINEERNRHALEKTKLV